MCACDDSVSRAEKFLQSIDRLKRDALIGCHPRNFCAQNDVLLGVRIAFVLRLTLDKQIGMCPQPNHIRCFTWNNLFLVKHFDLSLNWHRRTPHLLPIFLPNVSRGTLILSASPSPHFAINAPPPDQYHHSTTYEKQYCSTWNIVEISVTCNVIFHVKHIDRHADLMLFSL